MGAFVDCALDLRKAGWAVMPSDGKTPLVAGFNKWGNPPGPDRLQGWMPKFQNADVVAMAELCRPRRGVQGVVAVDPDDEKAMQECRDIFGPSTSEVLTRRGYHGHYLIPPISIFRFPPILGSSAKISTSNGGERLGSLRSLIRHILTTGLSDTNGLLEAVLVPLRTLRSFRSET